MTASPFSIWRFAGLCLAFALLPKSTVGADAAFRFTTLAGSPGGAGISSGARLSARFNSPTAVARDQAGNLYVADYGNNTIRRIDPSGFVSTFAGIPGSVGASDGPAAAATFNGPTSVAVDVNGNVFVADASNASIRRVTPSGVVSTFAGSPSNFGVADGPATNAQFRTPMGMAFDNEGNLLVADYGGCTIRQISPDGTVSTLAGSPGVPGFADGSSTNAAFNHPSGLAVGADGTIYVADTDNHVVRTIQTNGAVATIAGTAGSSGSADGSAISAQFNFPSGVVFVDGVLYIADTGNHTVRTLMGGVVSTLAGRSGVWGSTDGTATNATFNGPAGLGAGESGTLLVADQENDAIRRIRTVDGSVEIWAGRPSSSVGLSYGRGTTEGLQFPRGLAWNIGAQLLVADDLNLRIGAVTTNGQITTVADVSPFLTNLVAVAADSHGTLFAAGSTHPVPNPAVPAQVKLLDAILLIDTNGAAAPLAGGRNPRAYLQPPLPTADGVGSNAAFGAINAMAADAGGNLWVADGLIGSVRRVTGDGSVSTFAGPNIAFNRSQFGAQGFADGLAGAARFAIPSAISLDQAGNLVVADQLNDAVRRIDSSGLTSTLAGRADPATNYPFFAVPHPRYVDGPKLLAKLLEPTAIAVAPNGDIYVADQLGTLIRRISTDGFVTTIAGVPNLFGAAEGVGASAEFAGITSMVFDAAGNLYLSDTGNNRIVVGAPVPPPSLTASPTANGVKITLFSPDPGTFAIQSATTLAQGGDWQPLAGLASAPVTSGLNSWNDTSPAVSARFYRAVQLP
jgi:NHL repeat